MKDHTLRSYHAITKAKQGTRVCDRNGHTAVRVYGGWRYEASTAPGLMADWEMEAHLPFIVLEVVALPAEAPPKPRTKPSWMGRLFWDPAHASPWVTFEGITEYRNWARDVRKARPGTRTEAKYLNLHTPSSLLASARDNQIKAENNEGAQ